MESKNDLTQYDGWMTNQAGQRLQLQVFINLRKKTGTMAIGDMVAEITKLKKLKGGSGLIGKAKVNNEQRDWSLISQPKETDFEAEFKFANVTETFKDTGAMLHYWLRDIKLPAA